MKKNTIARHAGSFDQQPRKKTVSVEVSVSALWKLGTFIFAVLFIVSLFTGGFGRSSTKVKEDSAPVPTVPGERPSQQPRIAELDLGDDEARLGAYLGDIDAPVQILSCEDYQCPFCRKFWADTLPELKKQYLDTGKAVYIYGDFPLGFHNEADEMHEAANCAGDQKKYWTMHDRIFTGQAEWSGQPDPAGKARSFAQELGLDMDEYDQCIATGKYKTEIQDDIAECTKAGTSGTPTFYVNGKQLVGAQPFSAFKTLIDAELTK